MTPGDLVKERRSHHGLSQRELAYRAGTSQSAIARIEGGDEDVTWTRLRSILAAMGDEPVLDSERVASRYDFDDLMRERALTPDVRLASALNFTRFMSELGIAGKKAGAGRAVA